MAHVQYTVAYVYYSNVFCNCTPVESSFCRAWSPQASITPLTSFCHSASQVHLCTHSLRENLPKPVSFVCHLKVSYALFERIGFEGREWHKNPFCFQKSLPSPWLFCNRAMLGAWAEKCFLQRGLRSHWCFLFLWVKPGGLGWVSKVSADVRCPRGKRGLHVGHWGGDGRTVDVAGHWGRVGGGHLCLEGAGCRGVSGCDGRGGVGGVHRWGVAGVHWGREGGDRRGVGSDGRRIAGHWRGSWDAYICNRALHCSGAFLRLLVLLPQVNLGMALALVAAGELAATDLAGEGLLARVRADVGR